MAASKAAKPTQSPKKRDRSGERRYRNIDQPGEIESGKFYSQLALYQRFGCSKTWFRKARQADPPLKFCRIGRQKGCLGSTLIEWLKTQEGKDLET